MVTDIGKEYEQLVAGALQQAAPTTGSRKVDVVINVYGKPYNTAVTLYTLMKHSGQWIDKIYFIEERKQPHNSDFGFIKRAFGDRMISYTPGLWLWVRPFRSRFIFRWPAFRRSVRYQYGWEQTDKDHLFITHNDVLYIGDVIGAMLLECGDNAGIGPVGQCWNCSAHFAGRCTPETYTSYHPEYDELQQLLKTHPGSRAQHYRDLPHKDRPWPLPECRLNEWTALINMKLARPVTMPQGKAVPFGAFFGLDIGTRWFSDILTMGHTVKHFAVEPYASHAWAGTVRNGHAALLKEEEYLYSEKVAAEHLQTEINAAKSL